MTRTESSGSQFEQDALVNNVSLSLRSVLTTMIWKEDIEKISFRCPLLRMKTTMVMIALMVNPLNSSPVWHDFSSDNVNNFEELPCLWKVGRAKAACGSLATLTLMHDGSFILTGSQMDLVTLRGAVKIVRPMLPVNTCNPTKQIIKSCSIRRTVGVHDDATLRRH